MSISHASHRHRLELKHATRPYYCSGCDQLGFGLTYVCSRGCEFFLHQQCAKPKTIIEHPFSKKCVFRFRDGGSGVDSACDACGKKIKRLHYRCLCTFKKRNLHPYCLDYENTLKVAEGLSLSIAKKAPSPCLHCDKKDIWYKVRGWAYVSSCGKYCYHVACVREIINKNWRNGFFTGNSDPFLSVKQRFPEDMDRMNNDQYLIVARRHRPTKEHAKAFLSIIFSVVTGNPFGLIGAAQEYFKGR